MIVAVAGGFDPIHAGHIDHLRKASILAGQGGTLIVILARDDQLIKKKGFTFYPRYADREAIVSSIRGVKRVVQNIDLDGSCAKTLESIKPAIFAKGGDRTQGNMPKSEIDTCDKLGIEIRYGVGDLLGSSTELVKRLRPRRDYW